LAIKSVKKPNFHPLELLNQVYLQSNSEPSLFRFLAIKSVKKTNFTFFELLDQVYLLSISEPSLFRIFGHIIGQKGEFPSFGASESGLSPVHLRAFIIPHFWGIKSVKKANFPPLELLNQVYLQSNSEPSLFRFF